MILYFIWNKWSNKKFDKQWTRRQGKSKKQPTPVAIITTAGTTFTAAATTAAVAITVPPHTIESTIDRREPTIQNTPSKLKLTCIRVAEIKPGSELKPDFAANHQF